MGEFFSNLTGLFEDLVHQLQYMQVELYIRYGDAPFLVLRWLRIAAFIIIPALIAGAVILSVRKDRKEAQARPADASYFDGGLLSAIGWRFLAFLLTVVTCGLGLPWAICMIARWEAKHTVVRGRRLVFNGSGWSLFGKYLLWGLLTVVTCGIFSFWLPVKNLRWKTSHLHFADGRGGESAFRKGAFALYFRKLFARIGTVLTLGLAYPAIHVSLLRWQYRNTEIDGTQLRFHGTGGGLFVKYLLWALLTIFTLGLYAIIIPIRYLKWEKSCLDGVGLGEGLDESTQANALPVSTVAGRPPQDTPCAPPSVPRPAVTEQAPAAERMDGEKNHADTHRDRSRILQIAPICLAVVVAGVILALVLIPRIPRRTQPSSDASEQAARSEREWDVSPVLAESGAGLEWTEASDMPFVTEAPPMSPEQTAVVTPTPELVTPTPELVTPTPTATITAGSDLEAMVLEGAYRYYTYDELSGKSKYELSILRNGMYALCGKAFSKNQDVIAFFHACDWYKPSQPADADILPLMNAYEYANVMLIVDIERELGYR